MKRVVYRSISAEGVDGAEVFRIIETSARNNPERDITGFLLHDMDGFLQLLEGPPLEVEGLLARIERDPRHRDLEVVHEETAQDRWFPDWAMKRLITFGGTPAMEELRDALGSRQGGAKVLGLVQQFLES